MPLIAELSYEACMARCIGTQKYQFMSTHRCCRLLSLRKMLNVCRCDCLMSVNATFQESVGRFQCYLGCSLVLWSNCEKNVKFSPNFRSREWHGDRCLTPLPPHKIYSCPRPQPIPAPFAAFCPHPRPVAVIPIVAALPWLSCPLPRYYSTIFWIFSRSRGYYRGNRCITVVAVTVSFCIL